MNCRSIPTPKNPMKPKVICHMCTTIDGKILGDRWGRLAGGKDSATLFETTAASFGIGAWLVGTTTMKEFAGRNVKLPRTKTPLARRDHIADKNAKRLAIGVDAKGVLRFQENEVDGDPVVLLVTDRVGDDYLAHLQSAGVSYLFCGKKEVDLRVAIRKLGSVTWIRYRVLAKHIR
jgi:riboflavin biosynthesis pyrimidine reductase